MNINDIKSIYTYLKEILAALNESIDLGENTPILSVPGETWEVGVQFF